MKRLSTTVIIGVRDLLLDHTPLASVLAHLAPRFGTKYDHDGLLVELTKGLSTTVIGVRDLLRVKGSSDIHPSSSDTLTRLTLHLNQFWLTLQVWDRK